MRAVIVMLALNLPVWSSEPTVDGDPRLVEFVRASMEENIGKFSSLGQARYAYSYHSGGKGKQTDSGTFTITWKGPDRGRFEYEGVRTSTSLGQGGKVFEFRSHELFSGVPIRDRVFAYSPTARSGRGATFNVSSEVFMTYNIETIMDLRPQSWWPCGGYPLTRPWAHAIGPDAGDPERAQVRGWRVSLDPAGKDIRFEMDLNPPDRNFRVTTFADRTTGLIRRIEATGDRAINSTVTWGWKPIDGSGGYFLDSKTIEQTGFGTRHADISFKLLEFEPSPAVDPRLFDRSSIVVKPGAVEVDPRTGEIVPGPAPKPATELDLRKLGEKKPRS